MTSNEQIITKKDLNKMAWRALQGAVSVNYERFVHKPFVWEIGPALKKIWGDDKKGFSEALKRHLSFFLCTPQIKSWFGGLMIAMEEELKKNPDMDPASINAVKTSLMGPLSGIFDTLFLNCIRIIAVGVGLSFASQGSILGPILYGLIYNIPAFIMYFTTGPIGYKMGTAAITSLQESGLINKILEAASILGLIVLGGMAYGYISVDLAITFGPPEALTSLNDILNSIFPGLLKLAVLFLFYWLIKKKVNSVILVFGTIIVTIILVALGIM